MPDTTETKTEFLKDQLQKPGEDSKKWRMTIIGLKGVAGIFIVGAFLIFFKPDVSVSMATMVQFALAAWGGVVGIYLGAQGSVEFKTTAALEQANKNESIQERREYRETVTSIVEEGQPGAPARKPYAGDAQ